MIHVEVRNRIGKDAFDLFGRDLVLNEIPRIWKCRKARQRDLLRLDVVALADGRYFER